MTVLNAKGIVEHDLNVKGIVEHNNLSRSLGVHPLLRKIIFNLK